MIELTPLGVKEKTHNYNLQCVVPCSSRINLLMFGILFWFRSVFWYVFKKFLGSWCWKVW